MDLTEEKRYVDYLLTGKTTVLNRPDLFLYCGDKYLEHYKWQGEEGDFYREVEGNNRLGSTIYSYFYLKRLGYEPWKPGYKKWKPVPYNKMKPERQKLYNVLKNLLFALT